ncbi:hypothetical protein ILUMI_19787, partial [Ignelater luminosus]
MNKNVSCNHLYTLHSLIFIIKPKLLIAPSEINDVRITHTTTTSFAVQWKPPLKQNGNITRYIIKYKHVKYLGCDNGEGMDDEFEKTIYEEGTSTVLRDLLPYSEYVLEIVAFTIMDGKPVQFNVKTSATETPEASELPAVIDIVSYSTD